MSNIFTLTSLPFTETLKGKILFKYFKIIMFKKKVSDSRQVENLRWEYNEK